MTMLPKDKHDTSTIEQLMQLTDEEIEPILPELLTWLQDLNWPVAAGICEVIGKHARIAKPYVLEVLQGTDEIWKYNILSRWPDLCNGHPCGEKLLEEIQRIATHPTVAETEEEVHLVAIAFLESYRRKAKHQNEHGGTTL